MIIRQKTKTKQSLYSYQQNLIHPFHSSNDKKMAPKGPPGARCCKFSGWPRLPRSQERRAGIVVVKQITDERKWFQAMERIRETFGQKDYFKILPHFKKEDFNEVAMQKFNLDEEYIQEDISRYGFQSLGLLQNDFPTLFKFEVDGPDGPLLDVPCLPVFGRHFINCTSEIFGHCHTPEIVLKQIFRILKEYFPTNIAYWSDWREERKYELIQSGLYKLDPNPWVSKEIFYDKAKESFSTLYYLVSTFIDGKRGFLEVRERFVSILNSL